MTMHGGDRSFPGFIPDSCIGGSCLRTARHNSLKSELFQMRLREPSRGDGYYAS
jgi:hypothetical protein